jgi:hypothetical protein
MEEPYPITGTVCHIYLAGTITIPIACMVPNLADPVPLVFGKTLQTVSMQLRLEEWALRLVLCSTGRP